MRISKKDEERIGTDDPQMADTESGTVAEEMYRNLGFVEVGKIPNFANSPAGGLRDETFFYKQLS